MSRSAQEIQSEWLAELLPSGAAWARDPDSNLAKLLLALAETKAALEADISALRTEISPLTSQLLLADYQSVLGDDPYGRDIGDLTTDQLRMLLFSRWTARGGQSISYYEALGMAVGVKVTVYEPQPAVYGVGQYGAQQVYSLRAIDNFTWVVLLPTPQTGLEAIILANRQPDTQVVFVYGSGTGFGEYDFSSIWFGV